MTQRTDGDGGGVHVIDSSIYRDQFGTDAMRSVFSDESTVRAWAIVEAAIARACAEAGIIPRSAAEDIASAAKDLRIDLARVKQLTDATDHPLVPFIRVFSESVPNGSGEFVHWGVTTQDVMDTGRVLQLKQALDIMQGRVEQLMKHLADLSSRHRSSPMAGRTHGQHALPITFGLKTAVLLAELLRHHQRLQQLRPRLLVVQLFGAVGTLASLGPAAPAVRAGVADALGLGVPSITWHSARDGFAEYTTVLAMIGASCAKAANEVIQLQRPEIGELAEPSTEFSVGSSTMPQKRNPMVAEAVVAIGRILRQQAALALDAMVQQHERDMSAWQAEWEFIPETSVLADGALKQTVRIYRGLEVDTSRMAANLRLSGGLISAEAVMMALAPHLGRNRAHSVISDAARRTGRETSFVEALLATEEVVAHLNDGTLRVLLEPGGYLGEAPAAVDAVLAELAKAQVLPSWSSGSSTGPDPEHRE